MILILVLTASILTACKTVETVAVKPDETMAREALVALLPDPPEVPELPALHWSYKDGLYGLSEEDVDRFLNFKENTLPGFAFDYRAWIEEVEVVLKKLI